MNSTGAENSIDVGTVSFTGFSVRSKRPKNCKTFNVISPVTSQHKMHFLFSICESRVAVDLFYNKTVHKNTLQNVDFLITFISHNIQRLLKDCIQNQRLIKDFKDCYDRYVTNPTSPPGMSVRKFVWV